MHSEDADETGEEKVLMPTWLVWLLTLLMVAFVVGCSYLAYHNLLIPLKDTEHLFLIPQL